MVTGDTTEETEPAEAPRAAADRAHDPLRGRPLLVFVHDDPDLCDGKCHGACQRYFDVEEQVFSQERILLALRAFRPIRMTPAQAAEEPLLAGLEPKAAPRLVIVDVARDTAATLPGGNLSANRVYAALKRTASKFYKERLDSIVKKHLKLLGQHDKLAQDRTRVEEQLSRTEDERRADKLENELDEIKDAQDDLDGKIEKLWQLTLRDL